MGYKSQPPRHAKCIRRPEDHQREGSLAMTAQPCRIGAGLIPRRVKLVIATGVAGMALAALLEAPAIGQAAQRCTVAFLQSAAPSDSTVTSAVLRQDPVPHCKVEGYSITNH